MPTEIILIGDAAILANYGFRDMTTNIDTIIHASFSMQEAINHVGDKRIHNRKNNKPTFVGFIRNLGDMFAMNNLLIGNRIRTTREIKGIIQERLAELTNLSSTAISNIEIGKACPIIYLILFI